LSGGSQPVELQPLDCAFQNHLGVLPAVSESTLVGSIILSDLPTIEYAKAGKALRAPQSGF
jgi:hypothetical protein